MLKITILAVGRLKEPHWQAAQKEFLVRLGPMAKVEVVETSAAPITASFGPGQSINKEGEGLLKRIPDGAAVIALAIDGQAVSSEKFATQLASLDEAGAPVCFVIGGAAGLSQAVLDRADRRLSLSPMTLTHEMARVLLLEQIYRGLTINSGKKYHY